VVICGLPNDAATKAHPHSETVRVLVGTEFGILNSDYIASKQRLSYQFFGVLWGNESESVCKKGRARLYVMVLVMFMV
jgi:hypothetical protein